MRFPTGTARGEAVTATRKKTKTKLIWKVKVILILIQLSPVLIATDLPHSHTALARQFPDLKMLEHEDSSESGNCSNVSHSLPVHDSDLVRLNSIAVKIRRSPLPLSSDVYSHLLVNSEAAAHRTARDHSSRRTPLQSSNPAGPTHSPSYGLHNITRPLFRPASQEDTKTQQTHHTSYTSIVNSWLTPYLK